MKQTLLWLQNQRAQLVFLFAVWLCIQTGLYLHYGVNPVLESLKYIGAANHLIETGKLPSVRYYFYLSTTLLIAAVLKMGGSFAVVVAVQLLMNAFALFRFYKALYRVQKESLSALVCCLCLIACLPYQTWNFYLYTESLFYSFILLFFSSCIQLKMQTATSILKQGCLLLLVIISRPLGILFLPCWLLFLILQAEKRTQRYWLAAAAASVVLLIVISNFVFKNIGDWNILTSAENNEIICDIPLGPKLDLSIFANQSPLLQLYAYISNYPGHFLNLALRRLQYFLLLTRWYYSTVHNALLLCLDAVLYLPLLAGAWGFQKVASKKTIVLSISIIGLFALAICVQCDDYHNRFHHAIIPVFLYAGLFQFFENGSKSGLKSWLSNVKRKSNYN